MKCEKCGKDIPEGENKFCDDCMKKLMEDLSEESNSIKKGKVENNFKNKIVEKYNTNNIYKYIICIISIILILLICLISLILKSQNNNIGNSIGNIRNYGFVASEGKWIYYLVPDSQLTKLGIYRVKNDGSQKKEIIMEDEEIDIRSINAYKGYLYFIERNTDIENNNSEDYVDNKICRIKSDGSKEKEVLNDNRFNNDCLEIYVVNDFIYYIGEDLNIYKMDLEGNNASLVSENGTGYLGITDKYILYNKIIPEENDGTSGSNYVTYIMDIDGKNERPVLNGDEKRLYSINIIDNYIYYTNEEKKICKTKIDSNESTLVYDIEAYNLNAYKNSLYFFNYDISEDENTKKICIYKVNINDENNIEKVKTLETFSQYIGITNDRIIYTDGNDSTQHIDLISLDGKVENVLFEVNYINENAN